MLKSILLALLMTSVIFSQNHKITGIICNIETKDPVAFVNVRIAGTTQGTSSNQEGEFILVVPASKVKLIFTIVGYKTSEIEITDFSRVLKVGLKPEPVQFMEIVVGADEDPAYRIVREAIKRKEKNRAGLESLEYNFFSKDIFRSAKQVSLISEKFSVGYYQKGKAEKIIARSVHISENEKKNALKFDQNILDKIYIDFTDDTLMVVGNKVILPLAHNAFDWYDYHLKEVKQSGNVHECYIEVIPKSKIQPLVEGMIVIEDSSYSLKNVQLKNSEGLRFPYVNDLDVEFVQNRERYDNYFLPTYLKMKFSLRLNFANLIGTDQIASDQTTLFTNYKINPVIPDSIYKLYATLKPDSSKNSKVKFIRAEELSRAQIDSLRPIPLTASEIEAYKELDSTKTLLSQIKFTGVFAHVASNAVSQQQSNSVFKNFLQYVGTVFSMLSFRDNRVDGILLGGHYKNSLFENVLNYKLGLGYAFGRKDFEWKLNTGISLNHSFFNYLDVELFDEAVQWQLLNLYPDWLNSANVILGFGDQFNYYRSSCAKLSLTTRLSKMVSSSLEFIYDKQSSLTAHKYQSIFNTNRFVRENPSINEGYDNRLSIGINIDKDPQSFQPIVQSGAVIQIEISNPFFGSQFNYKRFRAVAQFSTKTLYAELFSSPYFVTGVEGGIITGDFGTQHMFTPNTALNIYSPFLTFKALSPYEFVGDKMFAVHAEHNWRTVLFQAAGLSFLSDLFIDFITGANVLKLWNTTSYLTNNSQNNVYGEVYASLARILGFGRIDFAYSSQRNFVIRVGLSAIL